MKSHTFRLYFLSVILLLAACKREDVPVKVYDVPAELQVYIDLFEQEAAKRGQTITIDNLRVLYEGELVNGTAAGTCTYPHADDPIPTVRFDTTSLNWTNNAASQEILVFHELGHCVLNRREHRDEQLPNGNFASIMRSTGAQVYGGALNDFKRDYYLDELFDPTTPAPDWATNFPEYVSPETMGLTSVFIDDFVDNRNFWNLGNSANVSTSISNSTLIFSSKSESTAYFTSKETDLQANSDFIIEANMKIASGENSVMVQWGGPGSDKLNFFGFTPGKSAFVGNWTDGIVVAREISTMIPSEFTKLTIRKEGTLYYMYVNGAIFDVLSYETLEGGVIAFYVGAQTTLHVDYVHIYEM
ncbi:MAG: hypothetical protein SF052_18405 [Bacteroidia bacterium]|nr:hypothetical protein [Bacteroidia bacterium]